MQCNRLLEAAFAVGLILAPAYAATPPQQAPDDQTLLDNAIDRWNRMSPEQRERELAKLPPERARLIRQRLQRYNAMSPQEQQAVRQRYQLFSELPQAQQQLVRQRLNEFRQLPLARRPIVHSEVEQLRKMPPAQREARMNSEEYRNRYNGQEQAIIHDLTEYLGIPDLSAPHVPQH